MRTTKVITKKGLILCLLLGLTALLSSLPLLLPGIEGRFGQDLGFHLMRIEGIARELEKGVFPVKMQSLWMDGYGYPVSVYYGDLLLYLPAAFRLLGIPVVVSYKLFAALINLGTVIISFFSFRGIFREENRGGGELEKADWIGLACAAAYTTAGYRLVNLYVRAAVGEYCAMMFLPLIAAAVFKIYRSGGSEKAKAREKDRTQDGKKDRRKERAKDSLMLALGLSGLIGTHLLTTEMVCVILFVTGLLFWRRTFSGRVFPTLALAFGETVLFNLYFLIPFADYGLNVPVYLNHVVGRTQLIQEKGADFFQLAAFWASPFHEGKNSSYLPVTPGPLLLLVLAAVFVAGAVCLCRKRATGGKQRRKNGLRRFSDRCRGENLGQRPEVGCRTLWFALASLLLIFVSSRYFPWDALAQSCAVGQFLAQVQFPWRYMGPAVLFLTLTLGSMLERVEPGRAKAWKSGLLAAAFLSCFGPALFTVNYARGYEPVFYKDTEDLDTWDMGMIEYLRYGTKREELSGETVKRREEDGSVTVELPVISYPGYHVVDSGGNEYNIKDGKNNVIQVTVPADFSGELSVSFQEPWYWRAGEILSGLSLLLAVCLPKKTGTPGRRRED